MERLKFGHAESLIAYGELGEDYVKQAYKLLKPGAVFVAEGIEPFETGGHRFDLLYRADRTMLPVEVKTFIPMGKYPRFTSIRRELLQGYLEVIRDYRSLVMMFVDYSNKSIFELDFKIIEQYSTMLSGVKNGTESIENFIKFNQVGQNSIGDLYFLCNVYLHEQSFQNHFKTHLILPISFMVKIAMLSPEAVEALKNLALNNGTYETGNPCKYKQNER